MAKVSLYSIHDSKVGVYNAPFVQANDNAAIRAFTDEVNNPDSLLNRHPEDFTLFCLGSYDDDVATSTLFPVSIVSGLSVKVS